MRAMFPDGMARWAEQQAGRPDPVGVCQHCWHCWDWDDALGHLVRRAVPATGTWTSLIGNVLALCPECLIMFEQIDAEDRELAAAWRRRFEAAP